MAANPYDAAIPVAAPPSNPYDAAIPRAAASNPYEAAIPAAPAAVSPGGHPMRDVTPLARAKPHTNANGPVEEPRNEKPSTLSRIAEGLDVPLSLEGALFDKPGFNAGDLPEAIDMLRHGKIDDLNRKFFPLGDESLARQEAGGDRAAAFVRRNAPARAAATFVSEFGNPSNIAVNPLVNRAVRIAAPAVSAAAKVARAGTPGLDPALTAATYYTRPIANAVKAAAAPVGRAVDAATYPAHMLAARALHAAAQTPPAQVLAKAAEAVQTHTSSAKRAVDDAIMPYFSRLYPARRGAERIGGTQVQGDSALRQVDSVMAEHEKQASVAVDRIFRGTSKAQQIEILRRSQRGADGAPILARDAAVPDPTIGTFDRVAQNARNAVADRVPRVTRSSQRPATIDERAADLRQTLIKLDQDREATSDRILPHAFDSNTYLPMRTFNHSRPVWKFQDETAQQNANTVTTGPRDVYSFVPEAGLKSGGNVPRGGRYVSTKSFANAGKKRFTLFDEIDPDKLADTFSPADQIRDHMLEVGRAIGGEQAGKILARPLTEGGLAPREPIQFFTKDDKSPGGIQNFGEGQAGRKAATNSVQRNQSFTSAQEAVAQLVAEGKISPAAAKAPIRNLSFILGKGFGSAQGAVDLGRAQQRAEVAANALRPGKIGAFTAATDHATRTGETLGHEADAVDAAIGRNREATTRATENAQGGREAVKFQKEGATDLDQLHRSYDIGPTDRAVMNRAREMHGPEAEDFERLDPGPKSVTPDWVWNGKRWALAGEFADVPKRVLDLSNRPNAAPQQAEGIVARVNGNADDVATQKGFADGDDMRDWLRDNRTPPRIADYLGAAREHIEANVKQAFSSRSRDALERLGLDKHLPEEGASAAAHATALRNALDETRARTAKLEAYTKAQGTEAAQRRFADRTFGPVAASVTGAMRGATRRLADIQTSIVEGQQRGYAIVKNAANATQKDVDKSIARLDDLSTLYHRARSDAAARDLIRQRAAQIISDYADRGQSPSDLVSKYYGHAPAGYERENDIGLGWASSPDYAMQSDFARVLKQKGADPFLPPGSAAAQAAESIGRGIQTLSNLARASIIIVPTVHGIFNLGMAALGEGMSPVDFMNVLRGDHGAEAGGWLELARKYGAVDESFRSPMVGSYANPGVSSTRSDLVSSAKGLGKIGAALTNVDQQFARRVWSPAQHLVFDVWERGYSVRLFRHFIQDEKMAPEAAAMRVRRAMNESQNVTQFEKTLRLNQIFFFYPWMKSALPFWIKKGIAEPRTWQPIVAAIREQNRVQGYDDRAQPFTITEGHEADGNFARRALPFPQRMLAAAADFATAPVDAARGMETRDFSPFRQDLKRGTDYLTTRLNPAVAAGLQSYEQIQGFDVPPYQRLVSDPYAPAPQIAEQIVGHIVGQAFGPARTLSEIGSNPRGAFTSLAGGGFGYEQNSNRNAAIRKRIESDSHKAINAARKAGRADVGDAIYEAMLKALKARGLSP